MLKKKIIFIEHDFTLKNCKKLFKISFKNKKFNNIFKLTNFLIYIFEIVYCIF